MSTHTADYVVVGAGAAGCALAARLSEQAGVDVLLLEAGPVDRAPEIHMPVAFSALFRGKLDWNFDTEPEPGLAGRRLYWPRGRVLGGSSSMNAQMYVRGYPADYDGWRIPGWTWADVLPLMKRSEGNSRGASPLHGGAGPQHVSDLRSPNPLTEDLLAAAAQEGLERVDDVNRLGQPGEPVEGAGFVQVTQHRGRRLSSARAFLRPALEAGRRAHGLAALRVVTDAFVQKIHIDDDGDGGLRATGVEAVVDGETRTFTARREVVLAAGTIGSPHLLMLSGIGPADQLRAAGVTPLLDRAEVGANLQDHLTTMVRSDVSSPHSLASAQTIPNLITYLLRKRGPLTSNVGEAAGFFRTSDQLEAPDIELIFAPVHFVDNAVVGPTGPGVTIGVVLQTPYSRGRVSLVSPDPYEHPRIEAGYLSDGRDVRPLVDGVRLARRIMSRSAFAVHQPVEVAPGPDADDDAALEAHVRATSETLYHPVGTCRMGLDADSVVDESLRVRGVAGLRVADVSVLPRIIRGHTFAPALVVAERAADLIGSTLGATNPSAANPSATNPSLANSSAANPSATGSSPDHAKVDAISALAFDPDATPPAGLRLV